MSSISKSFSLLFILILAVSSLTAIFATLPFGLAQSGTNVSYIISQDSTWTPAGSPYTLTGNTLVYQGVTLTIEAGVTVNLGSYYIEVNGTLSAIGTPSDKINFNRGQVIFTTVSNGWNEQTNSGCLIENSIISQTSISSSNPIKIDNCIINSSVTVTSSIISNNVVTGNINSQSATPTLGQTNAPVDTSVISNNNVKGNIVIGALYSTVITAPSEACTVSGNTVEGSIISGSPQGTPQIFNNTVTTGGIGCTGYCSIFNNYVYGCQEGISLYTVRVFGGEFPCTATVENNLIVDNTQGIDIELTSVFEPGTVCPTILNNTISENSVGIYLSESYYNSTPTIQNNNLQNNSNYNFDLAAPNNINATYNWWGTTDRQTINQTIYDFKNDFNVGTVNFVPFLTAPNPQAPSLNTPIPTPNPSPSPTSTPPSTAATPTLTSSSSPSPSPSLLPIELTVTVVVTIVIVAAAVGAFLLGKKAERNSKLTADYQI
jgi:parallel beta-helix repeat protein